MPEVVEVDMEILRKVMREEYAKIEKQHHNERALYFFYGIMLTLIILKIKS